MLPHEVSDDFSLTEPRIDPAQPVTLGFFIFIVIVVIVLIDRHRVIIHVVIFVIDADLEAAIFLYLLLH